MPASRHPLGMGEVGEPQICPAHIDAQASRGESSTGWHLGEGLVSGKTERNNRLPVPSRDLSNWWRYPEFVLNAAAK